MIDSNTKIDVPRAVGLAGQHFIALLREEGFDNINATDKHEQNLENLVQLHSCLTTLIAGLAEAGALEETPPRKP